MRVLVATTGNEGHFGPTVPFARAARAAGHHVAVAAPVSFARSVAAAGLDHLPFDDVPREHVGPVMARLPTLSRDEANVTVVREIFGHLDTEWALPGMRTAFREWRPDVVLRAPAEFSSAVVATEAGVATIEVAIGVGRTARFMRDHAPEALVRFGLERDAPVWESRQVSLVPASFDTPTDDRTVHRFRSAPAAAHRLPDWWPGADGPLVYVTFGSVAAGIGLYPRLYEWAVDQLADLDARILMTVGRAADPTDLGPLPAHLRVEQWVTQADVLAQAAASVGHGGFGTTLGTMAAGVPTVIVPLFAIDQFFNAENVDRLGIGIGLPGLGTGASDPSSAGDLGGAVRRLLTASGYRTRAAELASEIDRLPLVDEFPAVLAE